MKSQRDKLFKEVEKLIKKENFLEVIDTFDQISSISEKLGDTAIADEFKERANNLRSQLGQEVKIDVADLQEKINVFLMQLMAGPYGSNEVVPLTISSVPGAATTTVAAVPSRSLIDEGADIIARLKKIKGEEIEEETAITSPPSATPPVAVPPPPRGPPSGTSPPSATPPVAVPPPPRGPPSSTPPPPITPPINSSSSTSSATVPPSPIPLPTGSVEEPKSIVEEGAEILARLKKFKGEPVEVKPLSPSSPNPSSDVNAAELSSSPPIAIPIPDATSSSEIEHISIDDLIEEPAVQTLEPAASDISKVKLDEKSEIIERLNQELPFLPEKMKKKIIKELLKRPSGKLRETWLKVYIHKNKQYAEE
ncbi:MAG: hypothetical protein ACTSQQ_03675 [Candidatus Helarchaeota archaeon]